MILAEATMFSPAIIWSAKTVTADEISISYDFLVEAQGIFANWKGSSYVSIDGTHDVGMAAAGIVK